MLRNYVCPDCKMVVGEGSTSCVRCGCPMNQVREGRKTLIKLPYTIWAGKNEIKHAPRDKYGNPNGSDYDLLREGSMEGYRILLLNLCEDGLSYSLGSADSGVIKALSAKGFEVDYQNLVPDDFERRLDKACQLWIVSGRGSRQNFTPRHIQSIKNFYNQGKGLYLWADNDPFYADVNPIIKELFSSSMSGNYIGDKVVGVQSHAYDKGIIKGHLISTGIVNFYEGITISNVAMNQYLTPLVYSSDGKVVTAYVDTDGKRALIDGGFTRLYYKWDSAGTDRYVVNAAGWLGNFERFGWKIPRRK